MLLKFSYFFLNSVLSIIIENVSLYCLHKYMSIFIKIQMMSDDYIPANYRIRIYLFVEGETMKYGLTNFAMDLDNF